MDAEPSLKVGGRERLRLTARTEIADVAAGSSAKIVGRLLLGAKRLLAPLSGSECAAYEVLVRDGEGHEIARRAAACDFLVEDESGRAFVTSTAFQLVNHYFKLFEEAHLFRGPSRRAVALLRELGLQSPGLLVRLELARRFCFGERRIGYRERIAVFGQCSWEADPAADTRAAYRRSHARLRLAGDPVLASSDPELLG